MSSDFDQENSYYALLEHAARIAADVEARGDEIESDRAIPNEIVEDLLEHGFFRLLLPPSAGGKELDWHQFLNIVAYFARADASVGWCINQNNVFTTNFAKASIQAQQEVWGDPSTVVSNGPAKPETRATITDGGYRLSGEWSFSSGISHANWVAAISPVFTDDGSEPTATLHFLVRKEQVEVKDDWYVGGLKGTGSHGFTASDVFVPSNFAFDATSIPSSPTRYTAISTTPLFAIGFATVAVSAAWAAHNSAIETVKVKTTFGVNSALRDNASVQRSIGIASAKLHSASDFLQATVARIWSDSESLAPLSLEGRIAARTASTHAIQEAARATDLAYQVCGSSSIFASHPLQRRFQDVHTITQQVQGRISNYETVGQMLLGLEPKGVF